MVQNHLWLLKFGFRDNYAIAIFKKSKNHVFSFIKNFVGIILKLMNHDISSVG